MGSADSDQVILTNNEYLNVMPCIKSPIWANDKEDDLMNVEIDHSPPQIMAEDNHNSLASAKDLVQQTLV